MSGSKARLHVAGVQREALGGPLVGANRWLSGYGARARRRAPGELRARIRASLESRTAALQ
jgi:hypothetical protein